MSYLSDIIKQSSKNYYIQLGDLIKYGHNTLLSLHSIFPIGPGGFLYNSDIFSQSTLNLSMFDALSKLDIAQRFNIGFSNIRLDIRNLDYREGNTNNYLSIVEYYKNENTNNRNISETSYTNNDFTDSGTRNVHEEAIQSLAYLNSKILSSLSYNSSELRNHYLMHPFRYNLLLFKKYQLNDYYNSAISLPAFSVRKIKNNTQEAIETAIETEAIESYSYVVQPIFDIVMINYRYNMFGNNMSESMVYEFETNVDNNLNFNGGVFVLDVNYLSRIFGFSERYDSVEEISISIGVEHSNKYIMPARQNAYSYIFFNVYPEIIKIEDAILSEKHKSIINECRERKIIFVMPENIVQRVTSRFSKIFRLKSHYMQGYVSLNMDSLKFRELSRVGKYACFFRIHGSAQNYGLLGAIYQEKDLEALSEEEHDIISELIEKKILKISSDTHLFRDFSRNNIKIQVTKSTYNYVLPNQKTDEVAQIWVTLVPNFIMCVGDTTMKAEGNIKYTSIKFVSEKENTSDLYEMFERRNKGKINVTKNQTMHHNQSEENVVL